MISFQPGQAVSHAYILFAAASDEREEESLRLAAAMLCESAGARPCGQCRACRKVLRGVHPDVVWVEPEVKDHRRETKIGQIRAVLADAYITPTEAERKVFILREADTMNPNAQNAFLKLLEEPPRSASFILAVRNPAQLLPTVRSRCELLRRNTEPERPAESALRDAEDYLSACAEPSPAARLRWCRDHENDEKETVQAFLQAALVLLTDKLGGREILPQLDGAEALRQTRRMEQALEYLSSNVSVKHLMGLLSVPSENY